MTSDNKNVKTLLVETHKGFHKLEVDQKFKSKALSFLEKWLTDNEFLDYQSQIIHLIKSKDWNYLLDCFYQVIPFGTGGRRGEVGIGPNRINKWTIQASAQGHSQYLVKEHGQEAKKRGVVLAYDVRQFFTNEYFNKDLPNPVHNLSCKDLALAAAEVYTANDIKVYFFNGVRSTPELSFAIRYLKAAAGDMFSASHNPPNHNGKKVYDEHGGQLIPPYDEKLVNEVTEKVKEIKTTSLDQAVKKGLFEKIGIKVDKAYVNEVCKLSLSNKRNVKIVYTPLHGTGKTSVLKSLKKLGFKVKLDPWTSFESGKFENITFNIPNPEVIESFDTTLKFAKKENADLILNSDPDADRIGIMLKHQNKWKYINGQEIGTILLNYVIEKRKNSLKGKGVVIKTSVTTNIATQICKKNNLQIIGDLPVGFKYIGDEMNKLERAGQIDNFLFALEDSHGYIAGNYLRDKDACIGALWLSELAAELKEDNKTLLDYLNQVYSQYGYFRNYLTEIRMLGAVGMMKIAKIQNTLRKTSPKNFGAFKVERLEDFWDRKPIVSETDRVSKNVLVFHIKPPKPFVSMKVTIRPSGTEPKINSYFEIQSPHCTLDTLDALKETTEKTLKSFEKAIMLHCYKIITVDFPERGFLLFWQLPLQDKLHYFKIEPQIAKLKAIKNKDQRLKRLNSLVAFLGSDPLAKINQAFKAKYAMGIKKYLNL